MYRLPQVKPKANINDYLELQSKEINFPFCFPGEIAEENFEISNKSTEILNFKISVICQN